MLCCVFTFDISLLAGCPSSGAHSTVDVHFHSGCEFHLSPQHCSLNFPLIYFPSIC